MKAIAKASRIGRRVRQLVGSRYRLSLLRIQFPGLEIQGKVQIAAGCDIYLGAGSRMILDNVAITRDVTLTTAPGATLEVRADIIGRGSILVARERITIGSGSKVAEYVTVRDANHDHTSPLDQRHFATAPVSVGRDVWLAAKCTVLAGVSVGDGATVGAGAVVTRDVPPGRTAVGVPARSL